MHIKILGHNKWEILPSCQEQGCFTNFDPETGYKGKRSSDKIMVCFAHHQFKVIIIHLRSFSKSEDSQSKSQRPSVNDHNYNSNIQRKYCLIESNECHDECQSILWARRFTGTNKAKKAREHNKEKLAKSLIFIINFALLIVNTVHVEDERGRYKGSNKGRGNQTVMHTCTQD